MDHYFYIFIRLGIHTLFALYFLGMGTAGILTQRPKLFSNKWFFLLIVLVLLPGLLLPLLLRSSSNLHLTGILLPLLGLPVILVVYFWRMGNSFMVLGAEDQSLRRALLRALDRLGFKYTEDMTGLHIASRDIHIRTAMYFGQGQVRLLGTGAKEFSGELGPILREELAKPDVVFDPKPFFLYLAIGVMFLFLLFGLYNLTMQLESLRHPGVSLGARISSAG